MSVDLMSGAYAERVYAGVLGKMIGVYLGRPFENMGHRDVKKFLGEIWYYVHEKRNRQLVVADDDLSGTFCFTRAIEDHRATLETLTPRMIGQTWLNYIIENKTILWWGGLGLSTEHTAFLRLKDGIPAPRSGGIELNSKVVAEQIGSQIFIDGWAMVAPGDPVLAADLARRAASVSHDGEGIYGAQVVAAIESLAFVESDLNVLLDTASGLIPSDCVIRRMIADLREFHAGHPDDWEKAFYDVMEARYGYDKHGGNCHIIPNHGVIILALLYGNDNFQRSLMVANTCGWDTDCNSGNVGCIMGIKGGLAAIEAGPDWRGPVADRLLVPTAEGGECVTDAVRETVKLVNSARAMRGLETWKPKDGARFHFTFPGSVQGFGEDAAVDSRGVTTLSNSDGRLAIEFRKLARGRAARVFTATFVPPRNPNDGYSLFASPTLSPGHTVRAAVTCELSNAAAVDVRMFIRMYGDEDVIETMPGPLVPLGADQSRQLEWTIPPTGNRPIVGIGFEITGTNGADGTLRVDWLAWSGAPDVMLGESIVRGEMARLQWVEAVDLLRIAPRAGDRDVRQSFLLVQSRGRGMAIHGTRDWDDYEVWARITTHVATAAGLAIRVRGLQRYYALLLKHPNRAVLVRVHDGEKVCGEVPFEWRWNDDPHELKLRAVAGRITGWIDGSQLFDFTDPDPIPSGGIALVVDDGRMASGPVRVRPFK